MLLRHALAAQQVTTLGPRCHGMAVPVVRIKQRIVSWVGLRGYKLWKSLLPSQLSHTMNHSNASGKGREAGELLGPIEGALYTR